MQTGDVLVDAEHDLEPPALGFPEPVMSFAVTAKTKGDEDKVAQALRRLSEEDPTLRLSRDSQTGEELLSGMSQVHVEVAVERAKRRFGVEMELHQPRVPYVETIKGKARAHGRYKKQTGGRGQFGDCHIEIEPIEEGVGYEFIDKIVGGVIPQGFRPAVDKGIQEALQHGDLAGAPVQGVRVTLVDGSYHNVDSSEMAFKIAGSMAFRSAYEKAQPTLLEPIMEVEVTVPDESVGAINGDLNSRRGRLLGMEPKGGITTIKAEVPMAEVLTYNQALTSLTGGRGDYHMQFLRYDEVPAHIAQKLIEAAKKREGGGSGVGGYACSHDTGHEGDRRPVVRDLRADALDGGTRNALLAERRRRLRRRLPALRRDGGRVRLDPRGCADDADGAHRAAPRQAGDPRDDHGHAAARDRGDDRARADPAPALAAGARDRRGGRPLQRVAVPPHGRRDREVARRAAGVGRRPVRRERRGRRHRRVGHLLVPVPRLPGLGQPGAARRARPRSRRSSRRGFTDWNARLGDDGRIVPDIAKL